MSKERTLVGILGDEETITGFMFTGLESNKENPNCIIVNKETPEDELTKHFTNLISREDIAILFICDFVFKKIEGKVISCKKLLPSILEIPSKIGTLH
jgi:V-type H+-transporting ATPase subunit F